MATTPDDMLINAVMQAESRGKRFDKAGNLLTSVKGAEGEMQVMPTTQTKPGFGVKPAQDSSAEEKARVGRDYLKAMISKYGDTTAALAAYNWGPGRVNKWLENGGDFNALPKETQKYIKTIQASLPKGSQLASAPSVKANKAPVKTTSAAKPNVKPAAPPPAPPTASTLWRPSTMTTGLRSIPRPLSSTSSAASSAASA
jgi:soluble lytic murein transglycosylase